MNTLTQGQQAAILEFVTHRHLGVGLGTEASPSSMAAINLALLGRLSGTVPPCMSLHIGQWIWATQDMPDTLRNSMEWKSLLPLAAGTGRDPQLEEKRLALILDWMWGTALPLVLPLADAKGFGAEWRMMLTEKAVEAALAAQAAAKAPGVYHDVAEAPFWAAEAAKTTTAAVAFAAAIAARWAASAVGSDAWETLAPAKLLRALIEVGA